MRSAKRSQVTLFIILALIILVSVILFLFLKSNIEKEEIAPGVSMIVEELPSEFLPVRPYVENCLKKTAKQAITILGDRGG
jgi:hypothetical protein